MLITQQVLEKLGRTELKLRIFISEDRYEKGKKLLKASSGAEDKSDTQSAFQATITKAISEGSIEPDLPARISTLERENVELKEAVKAIQGNFQSERDLLGRISTLERENVELKEKVKAIQGIFESERDLLARISTLERENVKVEEKVKAAIERIFQSEIVSKMERENIESGRSEGAKKESRRRKVLTAVKRMFQRKKAFQNVDTLVTSSKDQEIRRAPSVPEPGVSEVATITPSNVQHETSADSVFGAEVRRPKSGSGRKHSLIRWLSRDSQESDDAYRGGSRSGKSSLSSLSLSKALKQLNPEETDILDWMINIDEPVDDLEQGANWPITIIQQPESQKVKTGTNIEFEFKCKANNRLTYKWFKDGTQLRSPERNNEAILQLKSVKMCDFGCYKCRVSCQDNPIAVVESDAVYLDVTPGKGTKYKSLTDVQRQDFQTYERVGCLLSQKKYGLGGWREVAHKYEMYQFCIDALRNDPEAGSKTLGFLESAVPELTVYDFCKTLKEHHIRRLDIVQELENHFSASATTFV